MKINVREKVNQVPNLSEDSIKTFVELLEMDDKDFENFYPLVKESLVKVYEGEDFQRDMLKQMELLPLGTVEENRKAIEEFLIDFDEDETLSDAKKDLIHTMFDSSLKVYEQLLTTGRNAIKVKICKLNPDAIIPQYAHPTDAGADVCAVEDTVIGPDEIKVVKTGIAVAIPAGYEIQVRPRSGLSLKTKLRIANSVGTIDADYRGEVGIIIHNMSDIPYVIDKGMKIAQLLIAPTPMISWDEVDNIEDLGSTERGTGGYGSTDEVASKG